MTADVIAARRQHIQDNTPCEDCGATLADCMAHRGEDSTAPPWFGCCARGRGLDEPCRHVPDAGGLLALLAEIESGTVRPVTDVMPASPVQGPKPVSTSWLLHQREWWKPKDKPTVRIKEMDPEWRYNCLRYLERRAPRLAFAEQWHMIGFLGGPLGPGGDMACDAFDAELERLERDPLGWLRSTSLYQALSEGLPTKRKKLARLAERARHWAACPVRADAGGECRCEVIAARCDSCRSGDLCRLCEGNGCGGPCSVCTAEVPEWTLS
jgi:hypothetical protein